MKNKNKVENEIYKIFAKELNLSKNFNFKKNLKNKNLPNLDSLSWIIIISNISKKFKIEFDLKTISKINTISFLIAETGKLIKK